MKSSLFRPFAPLRHVILALCVLATLPGHSAPVVAGAQGPLRVLCVGNSFSRDAIFYLPELAKAGGKALVLSNANIGGCSLERHVRHLKQAEAGDPEGKAYKNTVNPGTGETAGLSLPDLLSAQPWDIVTLQQWSQQSYKPETFQPFADELIAAIRKYAPTAEIVVHETWAYREDHPFFQENDGFTPAKMYDGLSATYKNFAASKGFRVIPVGDGFNLARQTPRWTYTADAGFDVKNPPAGQLPDQRTSLNIGWRWIKDKTGNVSFTLDAIHCNAAGRYLGAAVWYLELFNTGTIPGDFTPKGLAPEDAADLRAHALAAVKAERARAASLVAR
ncbi:MAG: hypothetical protein K0R17_3 [Rariglobus sp.]|jgi:hypothetical protein|nr:hypothetical protein [Rariglobus sp.]